MVNSFHISKIKLAFLSSSKGIGKIGLEIDISAPPKLLKIDYASHVIKYKKKSKIHKKPIVPNSTYIKSFFMITYREKSKHF